YGVPRTVTSFPTRRSSDLAPAARVLRAGRAAAAADAAPGQGRGPVRAGGGRRWPAALRRPAGSGLGAGFLRPVARRPAGGGRGRSEEHTSELQSRENLVCR